MYGSLEKYKDLLEQMKDLEKNEEQPDRYKNRGGRLLKEEQERNKLSKKIASIEQKLLTMAENYLVVEGKPFIISGRTIEEYINYIHESQKEVSTFKKINKLS